MKRNRKKASKFNIFSVLTSMGLGYALAWFATGYIPGTDFLKYAIYIGFIAGFAYFGYKKPTKAEWIAFAMSTYVIFQYTWDYRVGDAGMVREQIFLTAIVLLVFNFFTGTVGPFGFQKTAKRAIGLR